MTSETRGNNEPVEHKRFYRLRRATMAVAGIAMGVGVVLYASETTYKPAEESAPVRSPATTDQGEIDFRFTLDEDIAECHELRPLDDCIASNFNSSAEDPITGGADVPYTADQEQRIEIAECHELRPLDDCIASNF